MIFVKMKKEFHFIGYGELWRRRNEAKSDVFVWKRRNIYFCERIYTSAGKKRSTNTVIHSALILIEALKRKASFGILREKEKSPKTLTTSITSMNLFPLLMWVFFFLPFFSYFINKYTYTRKSDFLRTQALSFTNTFSYT